MIIRNSESGHKVNSIFRVFRTCSQSTHLSELIELGQSSWLSGSMELIGIATGLPGQFMNEFLSVSQYKVASKY